MFSPSEVVVQATRALQNTHPALRRLNVEGCDGALVISGKVNCYYLKQLAQETVKPLRGQMQLINRVQVTN